MYINFSDIPGNHNLFLDYLYEFENVKEFFPSNFRNKELFPQKFKKIAENSSAKRDELFSIISNQYSNYSPSETTKNNIELLKHNNTLAVVTGQQLGILGGPLYTIYKIITAIKLCKYLSEQHDNFNFVPVFWLEGDDHDFNEVRTINIINKDNELANISYGNEVQEDENSGSVGLLKIDQSINEFFSNLKGNLRETEFTDSLVDKLKNMYREGSSLKEAFKEFIFSLFDNYGLVLFDPQDIKVKELLKPVFKKEITDFRQHTSRLVNVSATLEEKYHAQVKVKPINLFYRTEEGRFSIEPIDNEFGLKRKRKKFTYDELMELIEKEPGNFSPNVLLRPICQDSILPTAFYIGGPSEISYFAQVFPLYDFYKIESPLLYPRSSATLVEKNIYSIIDKYGLNVGEIFVNQEKVKQKVVESISKTALEQIFNDTSHKIEIAFDELKEKLFDFDKTISEASSKYKGKVFHYTNELKQKAFEAQKRKHETTLRQIDKVIQSLYPSNNLQEREINFIYFSNKYGQDILKHIYEELKVNKFEHQIINF